MNKKHIFNLKNKQELKAKEINREALLVKLNLFKNQKYIRKIINSKSDNVSEVSYNKDFIKKDSSNLKPSECSIFLKESFLERLDKKNEFFLIKKQQKENAKLFVNFFKILNDSKNRNYQQKKNKTNTSPLYKKQYKGILKNNKENLKKLNVVMKFKSVSLKKNSSKFKMDKYFKIRSLSKRTKTPSIFNQKKAFFYSFNN